MVLERIKSAERDHPKRKLALFDIDGTLTKGYTIQVFADYLVARGNFNYAAWREMRNDQENYKKSAKKEGDYYLFADRLVNHYAQGIAGQDMYTVQDLAQEFFVKSLNGKIAGYEICNFARPLVEKFNRLKFDTIAISGSPRESLQPLVEHLGIKNLISTDIVVRENVYLPRVGVNMALGVNKEKVIEALNIVGYDFEKSFAFGDSMQDLPLLSAVGNSFVLGNNADLIESAGKNNWKHDGEGREILTMVDLELLRLRRDLL